MIHFSPVEHHIEDRAHTRLCDGRPANDTDLSSEDWFALRDARKVASSQMWIGRHSAPTARTR